MLLLDLRLLPEHLLSQHAPLGKKAVHLLLQSGDERHMRDPRRFEIVPGPDRVRQLAVDRVAVHPRGMWTLVIRPIHGTGGRLTGGASGASGYVRLPTSPRMRRQGEDLANPVDPCFQVPKHADGVDLKARSQIDQPQQRVPILGSHREFDDPKQGGSNALLDPGRKVVELRFRRFEILDGESGPLHGDRGELGDDPEPSIGRTQGEPGR